MKALYLTGSIIFTALILVLAFENINAQLTNIKIFFATFDSSPTIFIFLISVIGIITGALYHAFIVRVLETPEEDEETFQ